MCQADAEEEQKRVEKLPCTKLYQCSWIVEKETKEKWPRGRRKAGAVPKIEERYRLRAEAISQKEKEAEYDLRKNSCIVLISNVGEEVAGNRKLLQTYKGQQVVENSFRELKSPSMASVIYLKNPERIQALSMLLSFVLLVRAIIQYRMRERLKKFKEKHPGEVLRAGWGGRNLERLINCCMSIARTVILKKKREEFTAMRGQVQKQRKGGGMLKIMVNCSA